jgi:hypothetical protein
MLGHPDPQLLYNTYNGLVTPNEARLYWRIYPSTEAGREMEGDIEFLKEVHDVAHGIHDIYPQLNGDLSRFG